MSTSRHAPVQSSVKLDRLGEIEDTVKALGGHVAASASFATHAATELQRG